MRVLIVHNRYRSHAPSGENQVVEDEIEMLSAAGVEVTTYLRDSDDIASFGRREKAALSVRPVLSREGIRDVGSHIDRSSPDILHLHNPYPLISPQVIRTAARRGVPVVQTVHNYRHRFLPVSSYVGQRLSSLGIPDDRIVVKPNAVTDPGRPSPLGRDVLFAGRLDEEKGVRLVLEAWKRSGIEDRSLLIAGDGPLAEEVASAAASCASISWLGLVPSTEVGRLMDSCGIVVVPSLWFEGFPRTIAEAYARGRPVIATDHGALRGLVDDDTGWVAPLDPEAWSSALRTATSSDLAGRARGARQYYERHLRPDLVLAQQLSIYADVIDERRGSPNR